MLTHTDASPVITTSSFYRAFAIRFWKYRDFILTVGFFVYLYLSYKTITYLTNFILLDHFKIPGILLPFIIPFSSLTALIPVFLIEFIFNYQRKKKLALKHFPLRGISFGYLLIVVNQYILYGFNAIYDHGGFTYPHHYFNIMFYHYSLLIGIIINLFLTDLVIYFTHVSLHKFAFLWRFHSVHHAITDVSVYNSYQHIVERIFILSAHAILLTPIAIISPVMPAFLFWYITMHSAFIHSEIKFLNYGIFKYIIGGPVIHRAHHHSDAKYRDKNFAFFFPCIDMIFGTFVKPEPEDFYGPFGVEDKVVPSKVKDVLF